VALIVPSDNKFTNLVFGRNVVGGNDSDKVKCAWDGSWNEVVPVAIGVLKNRQAEDLRQMVASAAIAKCI
jgi:hypothetical protein